MDRVLPSASLLLFSHFSHLISYQIFPCKTKDCKICQKRLPRFGMLFAMSAPALAEVSNVQLPACSGRQTPDILKSFSRKFRRLTIWNRSTLRCQTKNFATRRFCSVSGWTKARRWTTFWLRRLPFAARRASEFWGFVILTFSSSAAWSCIPARLLK